MKKSMLSAFKLVGSCVILGPATVFAGTPSPAGAVIVRVDDGAGNGRCIGSSDKLTATLRRVILEKQSKWLGLIEDKELGLTFTATVTGSNDGDQKAASFAKVIKEPVSSFKTGQVSLAQEKTLLSQFALTNGSNQYSSIEIEVGVVRTEGKSTAAKILLGAVSTTKSLSLPANPLTAAFGIASAYVDGMFQPLLESAANEKEAVTHHLAMNINAAGCAGDDEKTGTKAIIDATENAGEGYVDTGKINSYCWKAELKPAFALKFAPRPAGGSCTGLIDKDYADLRNSYMALYVNAIPLEVPKSNGAVVGGLNLLAPTSRVTVLRTEIRQALASRGLATDEAHLFAKAITSNEDTAKIGKAFRVKTSTVEGYREALKRCEANGTSMKDCFN